MISDDIQGTVERIRGFVRKDIITDESGFSIYCPPPSGGGFSAFDLRVIADYMDEIDAPYAAEVAEYVLQNLGTPSD